MIEILISFVILVPLLALGLFLLVYKKPLPPGEKNLTPAWFARLSPEALAVHQKERNNATYPALTWRWFLEYLKGERSAFNAWFVWLFIGKIILFGIPILFIFFLNPPVDQDALINAPIFKVLAGIDAIYSLLACFILWRCAKNSTRGYKYIARIIALLSLRILFPVT